jgi:hypothetical protein
MRGEGGRVMIIVIPLTIALTLTKQAIYISSTRLLAFFRDNCFNGK